jgi:hypothetical protein
VILAGGAGADRLLGGLGVDTADYSTGSQNVVIDYSAVNVQEQPQNTGNFDDLASSITIDDGKKTALAKREWNFCERCGKRTADLTTIHTCTPPRDNT